jgi:dTDP-4-amino-4,6-dideoxygalactose transaminase
MAHLGAGVSLPGTDEAARTHLAIPISAAITREQVREVVDAIARCASGST